MSGVMAVISTAPDSLTEDSLWGYREQEKRENASKNVNKQINTLFMILIITLNDGKIKERYVPTERVIFKKKKELRLL